MFSMHSRFVRIGMFILVASALLMLPTAGRAAPDHADGLQIFTRDVFFIEGSSLRNPDDTTAPGASLFNDAGVNLNLTWGQWHQATASSTVHVSGKRTDVRIQLSGLVPGGVYSIFYVTFGPDSQNPACLGVERALPLTAFKADRQLPDPASFVAD